MIKNLANQYLTFGAIALADGLPITTGTPVVYLSKDNGAQSASTATATHTGNGLWRLDLTQAETNAAHLGGVMVLANAVNSFAQAFPYVLADFQANVSSLATSASITALNDFDPSVDTVATVGTVSNPVATDAASRTASQANVASLATSASITALNDFDPSVDTVATVGTVSNPVATDAASRTASQANVSSLATSASITALNDFDPSVDTVALVDTTTNLTNGGDATAANQATISAAITALNDFDPSVDTVVTVGTVSNPVSANVSTVGADAIDAASLKSDAVAEIQTGLATATELATVPKIGTQYTHTAQSGDTIQVTIS